MHPLSSARLSLAAGIALFLLKYAAYLITGSVALYSDALESIVNIVAGGVALFAIWFSGRPADREHPYGHTKIEYLSAVLEGLAITAAALLIIRAAVPRLPHPTAMTSAASGMAFSALATALNGVLAQYLIKSGRKSGSPALVGNGLHIWSDVVTSSGVLVGVGLALMTGWWILDPVLAILVALNILRVGWSLVRESVGGLLDRAMPPEQEARIAEIVHANIGEATRAHGIRTRQAGPAAFIEFDLEVPAAMPAGTAHAICDRLEALLTEAIPNVRTVIHVEPAGPEPADAPNAASASG